MKQRPRIYYTENQKALMWERRQKVESLQQISEGRSAETQDRQIETDIEVELP